MFTLCSLFVKIYCVNFGDYFGHMYKSLFSLLFLSAFIFWACERESFISDSGAGIEFSMDTLYFDTVFTSLSTVTKSFTIHNPHKEHIRISDLRLAGGRESVYRINFDGVPGTDFSDIEIAPGDSLYVFVEATLDPNNSSDILLQKDSIVTKTNGKIQDIDLVAWGQDVHLLRREVIETQTWVNDKPYLIIDYAFIDSLQTLTLEAGTRVYLHRDAILYVGGSLVANGVREEPIVFKGDRLESFYDDIPGQWGGIYMFAGTQDNYMNYVTISGANFGIIVDTVMNDNPTLEINNSTIAHMSSIGLLGRGAVIRGYNNLIYSCGSNAVALTIGGSYEFYHCTIANSPVYTSSGREPAVYMSNYYYYNDTLPGGQVEQKVEVRDIEKAWFGNSIIWGSLGNELVIDKYAESGVLNYKFENCIGRFDPMEVNITEEEFPGLINDSLPRFVSWGDYNFELDTLSPAKDRGSVRIGRNFPTDLNGNNRMKDGKPDIGAYERVEGEEGENTN